MGKLISIWEFICRRKYLITIVAFAVIIVFLDENSLLRRLGYEREISQLKEEIEKYRADYEENTKRLNEISTNPDAIEQIAREKYLMKKPNEDIYGFVVGGSLPLFQNRKKVKIAKAQAISAQLMQESAKDRVEASLMSLFNEMQQLKDAMNAYDVPLMYRSLDLLKQALTEGQISLIEYFVETESIYKNLQAYMQIENQYQKVMANIYKNNL